MSFDAKRNVTDAITVLFFEPCVVEVRVPQTNKGTYSGYFQLPDHQEEMVDAVLELTGRFNVYWTLNPCHPDLLARACNRTKQFQKNTTGDGEILRRHWLAIDVDPQRFAGISSSDKEKAAAKKVMVAVAEWLQEQEWPDPVRADSGNGYHLLYRIDLPNDEESMELVKSVLEALALRFNNDEAHVDTTLFNASRILKAYGTVACKGDSIPDRPHRYAFAKRPASPIQTVQVEQLEQVASQLPKPVKKARGGSEGGWTKALVEAAFKTAGIRTRTPTTFKGGLKWQHDCWSNDSHKAPDAFTTLDGKGWVSYKCSHNSCGAGMNSTEWHKHLELVSGCVIDKPVYVGKSLDEIRAELFMDDID